MKFMVAIRVKFQRVFLNSSLTTVDLKRLKIVDVIVIFQARKFDIIPTLTAIGSGVGIFGVVSLSILHFLSNTTHPV
jgi:hypothetical protein